MAATDKFKNWIHTEAARVTGAQDIAKQYAEKEINTSEHLCLEIIHNGKWITVKN